MLLSSPDPRLHLSILPVPVCPNPARQSRSYGISGCVTFKPGLESGQECSTHRKGGVFVGQVGQCPCHTDTAKSAEPGKCQHCAPQGLPCHRPTLCSSSTNQAGGCVRDGAQKKTDRSDQLISETFERQGTSKRDHARVQWVHFRWHERWSASTCFELLPVQIQAGGKRQRAGPAGGMGQNSCVGQSHTNLWDHAADSPIECKRMAFTKQLKSMICTGTAVTLLSL